MMNTREEGLFGSLFILYRIGYDADVIEEAVEGALFYHENNGDRACGRSGQAHEIEAI